jgi:hypothetical protein
MSRLRRSLGVRSLALVSEPAARVVAERPTRERIVEFASRCQRARRRMDLVAEFGTDFSGLFLELIMVRCPASRRRVAVCAAIVCTALSLALSCSRPLPAALARPNVVLIVTDDQGYGDLGFTGNPVIRTPHLDAMARRGAVLERFYVSPVCAPTRASLMTGRYNYRTRAIDTFVGRAMMDPDEVTLAEILRGAGYATAIFGKWHLGDCYPMRPIDQGFEEALVHRGGGIGQPSDPPGGEGRYTDPVLFHNGVETRATGTAPTSTSARPRAGSRRSAARAGASSSTSRPTCRTLPSTTRPARSTSSTARWT